MQFTKLQGQDHLRRALAEEFFAGTVSHAVLISGPPGSGKKTWGRALACALLCQDHRGLDPCFDCPSCRRFISNNHPGFFFLEPKGRKIKIEQIREIRGRFYLEGDIRVCLINQADRMTAETASSLLKILEEPPPRLYFILLAEQERRLFSTIVSRCRRFFLQPLNTEEIAAILGSREAIPPEKAAMAARLSGGLPGAALALAEDPAFEERLKAAAALAGRLASGGLKPREVVEEAAALADREDLPSFLEMIYLYFRDALMRQLCRNHVLTIASLESVPGLDEVPPGILEEILELINTARKDLMMTNVNRRLAVEGILIQLQRRFSNAQGYRGALSAGR